MPPASFANRPDGLSPDQRAILNVPYRIPPGYGARVLPIPEKEKALANLEGDIQAPMDLLLMWEPPRRGFLYVVSADVSSGVGQDRSSIGVTRVGTIREPDEQVAHFLTESVDETDIAYVIDSIGRLYKGRDGQFAVVAVECNGLGISTQNELRKHIGYNNLYVWQYMDAVEGHEFTTRYGWWTTQRSRPIMLQTYVHGIKTTDPHTGLPDYRVNSPHTIAELADFHSPGPLWMASAVEGAHDDCIMEGAIGLMVARTLQESTKETVHDARRRIAEEASRVEGKQKLTERGISAQTTDVSYDELMGRDPEEFFDAESEIQHYR